MLIREINGRKYHLFSHAKAVNIQEVENAYHISSPERIIGYAGVILGLPDIFISDELYREIQGNSKIVEEISDVLHRIVREEYGKVTTEEKEYNAEQRWLAGSFCDVVVRFDISCGSVEFIGYDEYAIIQIY